MGHGLSALSKPSTMVIRIVSLDYAWITAYTTELQNVDSVRIAPTTQQRFRSRPDSSTQSLNGKGRQTIRFELKSHTRFEWDQ
jgi:hypothetical protein